MALEGGDEGVGGCVVYGTYFNALREGVCACVAGEDADIEELRLEEFFEDRFAYRPAGLVLVSVRYLKLEEKVRTPAKATFLMLMS